MNPFAPPSVAVDANAQKVQLPTKKRSFRRGVIAGLLIHYAALAILMAIFIVVRPLLWSLLFGSPQWAGSSVDPNSGEGTVLQIVSSLSWAPGGIAAMRWGGNRGRHACTALAAFSVALIGIAYVGGSLPPMPVARVAWYWLSSPIGILIGSYAYSVRLATSQGTSRRVA